MTDPYESRAKGLMRQAHDLVSPDDVPDGWAVWEDAVHLWHGLYRPKPSMAELEAGFNPRICLGTRAAVLAEIKKREHLRELVNPT